MVENVMIYTILTPTLKETFYNDTNEIALLDVTPEEAGTPGSVLLWQSILWLASSQ